MAKSEIYIAWSVARRWNRKDLPLAKAHPKKLRTRAEELNRKSARFVNEADELIVKAEQIERADQSDTNPNQHLP